MRWASDKFKYLWRAVFKNKNILQDPNDLYSKHDPFAEYNPSSFRDFQEYFDGHNKELEAFELWSEDAKYWVDFSKRGYPEIRVLKKGKNWASDKEVILYREKRELSDLRVIYYRNMEATIVDGKFGEPRVLSYTLGYQGLDKNGNSRKKMVTVI